MARNLPHLIFPKPDVSNYTTPRSIIDNPPRPQRSRHEHAKFLSEQLDKAWDASQKTPHVVSYASRNGVYLEFKGKQGFELVTQSLEDMRKHVRLCNIRQKNKQTFATVFVPNSHRDIYFKKIREYADPNKNTPKGFPKNAPLIESIEEIEQALKIEAFWQGANSDIPQETPIWCEVWLRTDDKNKVDDFNKLVSTLKIPKKKEQLSFPERTVELICATNTNLLQLIENSEDIAEFRKAQTTAAFWIESSPKDQSQWSKSILERLSIPPALDTTICILDSGVTNGHPLLKPLLPDHNCLTANDKWGSHDHLGHGTKIAGIAAYGSIEEHALSDTQIPISHTLESVKLLPPTDNTPYELWGDITSRAISTAEIQSPEAKRIICMAVTAEKSPDLSTPSSWSGAIDQITSGAQDGERRLMIISAGNTPLYTPFKYPANTEATSIHNPAQAWNALSVGAHTELTTITDPELTGYAPVAPHGGISPYSSTSLSWSNKWPLKPEIMMEGGNAAVDNSGFPTSCNDLSVLTTHFNPLEQHFDRFEMTSLATAKAANFAARLQAANPTLWAESIRALMVHSAEWTEAMKKEFLRGSKKKGDFEKLVRTCGYGVPNFEKAMYSAQNSLTLLRQEYIQPYEKKRSRKNGKNKTEYKTKDFHLYELPWPTEVLQDLHDVEVRMKVTLSYFIDPSPGEVGWKDRYGYPSHGLRFKILVPGEDRSNFIKRVNAAVREENSEYEKHSDSDLWSIGRARDRGSIHSDIWTGQAAQLASSNLLAIHPTIGWWRKRKHLEKYNSKTRYSLIVTIEAPETDVNIYTPIRDAIKIKIDNQLAIKQQSLF